MFIQSFLTNENMPFSALNYSKINVKTDKINYSLLLLLTFINHFWIYCLLGKVQTWKPSSQTVREKKQGHFESSDNLWLSKILRRLILKGMVRRSKARRVRMGTHKNAPGWKKCEKPCHICPSPFCETANCIYVLLEMCETQLSRLPWVKINRHYQSNF